MMSNKSFVHQLYEDFSHVLEEAKGMGCNEILALRNIPLESMEEIVNALKTVSDLQDRGMNLETIERLISVGYEMDEKNLTIQSVTEAIKKSIAKEPVNKTKPENCEAKYWENCSIIVCPNCNKRLKLKSKGKYCDKCGQKLDWEQF